MTRSPAVEDLVLGHVLDDRRRGRGGGDGSSSRLGTRKQRQTRALLRNAGGPRGWQSVVKRIAGGSARTPQELKRYRPDEADRTTCERRPDTVE